MRFLLLTLAFFLVGCTHEGGFKLPGVYRIDIQQGPIIDSAMLSRLKPGMDKNQVQFIMGTPALIDPFHTERWEYIYTFSKGGRQRKQRHITLHFEDDKLAYIDGDVAAGAERPEELANTSTRIVDVPLKKHRKRGFFGKFIDKVFTGGDDDTEAVPAETLTPPNAVEPGARTDTETTTEQ